jgi:hypothetical protein
MKFQGESKLWSIVRDWARHQDILTVSRNVTLTLTQGSYHGHEYNEPLPGYRHLAIVGHVGCPHRYRTTIAFPTYVFLPSKERIVDYQHSEHYH